MERAAVYSTKKNQKYVHLYTTMLGAVSGVQLAKLKKQRKDLLNVEIKFRQAAFEEIIQ